MTLKLAFRYMISLVLERPAARVDKPSVRKSVRLPLPRLRFIGHLAPIRGEGSRPERRLYSTGVRARQLSNLVQRSPY